jgi:type IV secretory pathway TrbD component
MSERHPVYRALNRVLTIWGIERKLFFAIALAGAITFRATSSFWAGVVMFAVLFVAARWATATDPQMLRLLLNSPKWRMRYDPVKHLPFLVHVESRDGSAPPHCP